MAVIALAGRRIDAPESPKRCFPAENVPLVRERLRRFFANEGVSALVCSAACGADLLALEEAGALSIPRHIVLPFDPHEFRDTSVTDRPGDWGPVYDRILAEERDVLVLRSETRGGTEYAAVNEAILNKAATLAERLNDRVLVVLVWNGISRGRADLTNAFGNEARTRGFEVAELLTADEVSQKANL